MGNGLLYLAIVLLITAQMMSSWRLMRQISTAAALALLAHIIIGPRDPAAMLLAVAFLIACALQLFALYRRSRLGNITSEEQELLAEMLAITEPDKQQRLLGLMRWEDVPAGELLIREGQTTPPLLYIAAGQAAIEHDGKVVGECGPGEFLGEMSLANNARASASVRVTQDVRMARFDRDALNQMCRTIPEIGKAFDSALNRSLAAKVMRMNAAARTAE